MAKGVRARGQLTSSHFGGAQLQAKPACAPHRSWQFRVIFAFPALASVTSSGKLITYPLEGYVFGVCR